MGRLAAAATILFLVASLLGCGSPSATNVTVFPVPASITLSPAGDTSLDVGTYVSFSATARDNHGTPVGTPVTFVSSNTAVVTVATIVSGPVRTGLACAGTWDSLVAPQVCTPGPVGTAEITATARGVSSPPTTVHVHQHIDSIVVSPVPGQPPPAGCFSKDLTFNYQANAFSRGTDITDTVGPFTWQAGNSNVVLLSTTADGLLPGQAQSAARTPGTTSISASNTGVNSVPLPFTACPVQSITLAITGSSGNSFTIAKGGTKTLSATVVDTLGTTITGVPLTWCSAQPGSVGVGTGNCATSTSETVTATGAQVGASSIIASCTPPACNIGFQPTLPIYPQSVISATVTGAGGSQGAVVWVSSKGCGIADGCTTRLASILFPGNTLGIELALPATPNSLVFGANGGQAYLGTDRGFLGTKGLMLFNPGGSPPQITGLVTSVTGKVLAVSPDGKKVIVSQTDPLEPPSQVFVFDSTNNSSVALPIAGATAADFSPDSLKAYIVAGSTLYVYSQLDALQTIPLNAPATDVSFLTNGIFGYMAGGDPAGVSFLPTCQDPSLPSLGGVNAPGAQLIRGLPDGKTLLTLSPPNVQTITATVSGDPVSGQVGCPAPLGFLTVTNTPNPPNNLGQGSFIPIELVISPDGSRAYIFASNLGSVLVFDIGTQTSSSIALVGNAIPTQASITADGTLLYIGTADDTVHVVDTVVNSDIQQVTFPSGLTLCVDSQGDPFDVPCHPDLVAVRP